MIAKALKRELDKRQITTYRLSKITGIPYELLRRCFNGTRRLSADEFVLICKKVSIDMESLK